MNEHYKNTQLKSNLNNKNINFKKIHITSCSVIHSLSKHSAVGWEEDLLVDNVSQQIQKNITTYLELIRKQPMPKLRKHITK
jgi:hypothetical protein